MKSKLIVALDVDGFDTAMRLVDQLRGVAGMFKVGSQMFTRYGPRLVERIQAAGERVFLDLKFHDIPNTVAKAVESAAALRVHMLTVHTIGGLEMLQAAAAVKERPLIVGVTVLTSQGGDVADEVVRRARLAKQAGIDGVVASAHEIAPIRSAVSGSFLLVTPGIRPAGTDKGDQKRVMTPAEAVAAGTDYIVVGRPILAASDPAFAARAIVAEMNGG
jgi:orotidine-5'-phosphate decarboxylase